MRNPYVIALCVLSFAGVAYATGQIGVTGYPAAPRTLRGGTGINISPDGTFSATGEAVVTGSQPFGNLSSALRGKYLGASGTAVNAGAYKGNSAPTATEFGYLSGVKAPVQGQISSANVRIDTLNNTVITTSTIGSQTVAAATGNAGTATKLETARNINGVAFDGTTPITVRDAGYLNYSGHDHVTPALVNASSATPTDSDSFSFFNSVLKKVPWSGIKSTLKTYFDALYHGLTVTWSEITGKPTFATVATSGLYSDLSGKPAPYTLPTATPTTLGGVKIDNSSIQIDGSGVIHSTVAAGVSSVQDYTGDITLQLSDFPDIVAGLDSKVSQVAFNNRSTAQGTRDTAQDSAIALKASKSGDTFTGAITAPAYDTSGADNTHYTWDYNTTSCPSDAPEYAKCTLPSGVYWRKDGAWTQTGILPAYTLPAATASTIGGVKPGTALSVDNNGVLSVMLNSLGPSGLVTAGLAGDQTVSSGFAYVATSTPWKATFNSYTSTKQTTVFATYSGVICSASGSKLYWPNPITFTNNSAVCAKLRTGTRATVQMQGGKTYATATQNLQKASLPLASNLVNEGFEGTGAPTNWATSFLTGGGATNYDNTSSPLSGSQSLSLTNTGTGTSGTIYTYPADKSSLYVSFMVNTTVLPGSSVQVFRMRDASANVLCDVKIMATGALLLYQGTTSSSWTGVATNTTYYVQVRYASTGTATLWTSTDGTAWTQRITFSNGTATASVHDMYFYNGLGANSTVKIDQVKASDTFVDDGR